MLVDGPIVASIADSFDLYWASDWVTAPTPFDGEAAAGSAGLLDALPADEVTRLHRVTQAGWHPRWHACNDVHFVTDYPGSGVERRKVFLEIARLAQEAHQRIDVESPDLILRADGINLLQQVLDRGVQLRILTNSLYSTDAFYTVASLARALDRLQQPGLEVWAYNGEPSALDPAPASKRWGVHAKRAVFDETISLIGTYNIDPRSANLNSELILVCRDSASLAAEMRRDIRARMAQARPVVGTAQPGGYEALVEGADSAAVRRMWLVSPLANWLDFLM
jgi:putative cardiolipin synthase